MEGAFLSKSDDKSLFFHIFYLPMSKTLLIFLLYRFLKASKSLSASPFYAVISYNIGFARTRMDKVREFFTFSKRREQKKRSFYLQKNGGLLLEDLIGTFGARYNVPVRIFTAQELIRATNNFSVFPQELQPIGLGIGFFKGSLEERPVLVQHMNPFQAMDGDDSLMIRDIAFTSQMNQHRNVLPLIGCCLELEYPALVFDNALDHVFLANLINPYFQNRDGSSKLVLSWIKRIKIAKDISSVLVYMHTAFSTPSIFRCMDIQHLALDNCGVAKLFGFGLSISLPPGETKVEAKIMGTYGIIDPEYFFSGIVTEKTDVYGMGMLMLQLLSGNTSGAIKCAPVYQTLLEYAKRCIKNDQFKQFIDPKVSKGESQDEDPKILQHLLACTHLALRCAEEKGENRPEMIDVAKELSRIEKSLRS